MELRKAHLGQDELTVQGFSRNTGSGLQRRADHPTTESSQTASAYRRHHGRQRPLGKAAELPRVEGHRAGIQSVKSTVELAARLTVPVLTLYAFSSENWKRPRLEVSTLWNLLREYLRRELPTLQENNIRFGCIGRVDDLPRSVQRELKHVADETRDNTGTRLMLALSYSGRLELVDAVNRLLLENPLARFGIVISSAVSTLTTFPTLIFLIRTSGEMRISNFLLWQIALCRDLRDSGSLAGISEGPQLLEAIQEYQNRERRYGDIHSAALQGSPS